MKELKSGIKVDSTEYYKLLDWRDKHQSLFRVICIDKQLPISINDYTKEQYNTLLECIGYPL